MPLQRSIAVPVRVSERDPHLITIIEATKINYKTDFLLTGCIEISIAVIFLVKACIVW